MFQCPRYTGKSASKPALLCTERVFRVLKEYTAMQLPKCLQIRFTDQFPKSLRLVSQLLTVILQVVLP